jgi:hypothetical protein
MPAGRCRRDCSFNFALAIVVGALTMIVSIAAMMIARAGTQRRTRPRTADPDAVFWAGGALFVRTNGYGAAARLSVDRQASAGAALSFDDDMTSSPGARNSRSTDLHRKGMTFERVVGITWRRSTVHRDRMAARGTARALGAARDYVPDAVWQDEVQQRIRDAAVVVLVIGSQGLAWELSQLRDLGQLHKLILLFPPADDVVKRWHTLLGRDRAEETPILPDEVRPEQTLALIYADDLTPIIVEGKRDEWSYQTALRLGGMLAITTGIEPVAAPG